MSIFRQTRVGALVFIVFSISACSQEGTDMQKFPVEAPIVWTKKYDSQMQAIRDQNKSIARQCAAAMKGAEPIEVVRPFKQLCRKPDLYKGTTAIYRVSRTSQGRIGLGIRIALDIHTSDPSPERANVLLEQVRACIPELRSIFDRYDIDLLIEIDSLKSNPSLYDHTVHFHDDLGRSSSHIWYALGNQRPGDETLCSTVFHEVGHLLSLHDEYLDEECPDREFISHEDYPFSIMKDSSFDYYFLDFYPRHISQILRPACPLAELPLQPNEVVPHPAEDST